VTSHAYRVGRGISDVTGEASGCGMLGYGKADQVSAGIHQRLRTRAFIFVDEASGDRLLLSVSDLPLMFDSVHRAVLQRLADSYGELYTDRNVMLTVTHTHCGPGGYSDHRLYNATTHGFHPRTFRAIVDGIVEAIDHAHADIAPADLTLSHGELRDASVNRSPQSFARNPRSDRDAFPDGVDPQTTLLRIDRDGSTVGAINWFATHGTSMTNRNCLISGDNKGYAGYHWERLVHGVDYLAPGQPEFIGAFAQTNAGDMSPNLNRGPGSGPTDDEFENTRLIGARQAHAAAALAAEAGQPVTGGLDVRMTYVDLADVEVSPEFTGDGKTHSTSGPAAGAAAIAGTDEGKGFPGFKQGRNPVLDAISRRVIYPVAARQRDSQYPKSLVIPGATLNRMAPFVQHVVPVQLFRIGQLHLIGIPGEVTIVAGLRMRRAVADVVGADLHDVLVAGYSNAYIHYVTTPEEYDEQRYEGGSTLFGRWEAPALTQIAVSLAAAMRDGVPVDRGTPPPDLSHTRPRVEPAQMDHPIEGTRFGDIVSAPIGTYRPGEQVRVVFSGAKPSNDQRRNSTFVEIEIQRAASWERVIDDGDWATKFAWQKLPRGRSRITITWDIPADVEPGIYRLRYLGDAADFQGRLTEFGGTTAPFAVTRAGAVAR